MRCGLFMRLYLCVGVCVRMCVWVSGWVDNAGAAHSRRHVCGKHCMHTPGADEREGVGVQEVRNKRKHTM